MKKKPEVLAQLDVMSNRHGHKPTVLTVVDDPARRAELAVDVNSMIKKSFVICLDDGQKVVGYDDKSNSWLIAEDGNKKPKKVSAQGQKATATPMIAGG